jgi:hypothetical protein
MFLYPLGKGLKNSVRVLQTVRLPENLDATDYFARYRFVRLQLLK